MRKNIFLICSAMMGLLKKNVCPRRLLASLVSTALALSVLTVPSTTSVFRSLITSETVAAVDSSGKLDNGLFYELRVCEAIITDCDCNVTAVVIPAEIEDCLVTAIDCSAFSGCSMLQSITIPDSVTFIDKYAFEYCSALTTISIPDSVTGIGRYIFRGCSALRSITIPNNLTYIPWGFFSNFSALTNISIPDNVTCIEESAFSGCSALKSITIPDSVSFIGYGAFSGCSALKSITIPDSVSFIDWDAFSDCSNLQSITIPDSVTTIGEYAFSGCSALTAITVSEGNATYHSAGNCLIETDSKTLVAGCQNSVIPNDGSVTSIGDSAFHGCSNLQRITIPDSVSFIGRDAFSDCSALTAITVSEGNATYHSAGNCLIETDSKTLIAGCQNSVIPNDGSVTSIGDSAFYGCETLASITIPDCVTDIGLQAFWKCPKSTIYGYIGSCAETYAKNNSIPFDAIGTTAPLTPITIIVNRTQEKLTINLTNSNGVLLDTYDIRIADGIGQDAAHAEVNLTQRGWFSPNHLLIALSALLLLGGGCWVVYASGMTRRKKEQTAIDGE